MEPQEALIRFLGAALADKRERICEFASKPRTRGKFFDLLYHSLGQHFAPSAIVSELPETVWRAPALAFVAPDQFAVQCGSLREGYQRFGEGEGALLITADGAFGIWCDHTYVDDRVFVTTRSRAAV